MIRCGAIPKKDLIIDKKYEGSCRNTSIAIWKGDHFEYVRSKFGCIYIDKINHLTDEVSRLETTDNEIKTDLEAETARAKEAEEAIIYDVSSHNDGTVFESL